MQPEFYTIGEAAGILRVKRKTVYDWMKSGRLSYVQAGLRKRLIPREALEEFKRRWGVGLDPEAYNPNESQTPSLAAV